ncbi:hypothetical protein K788_0008585 (plasmid) [Paraburkholderia caribensis MBA4]|uniref:Uncharacterized protein n=1 Tax=Paraburkholderia caribensis MBA4 TaxID=1323664 RepID=A0A0P0RPF3_9BURK|nr:hypothetical protein K788_0008585 [Paraburkholderia caribensis MBA4]
MGYWASRWRLPHGFVLHALRFGVFAFALAYAICICFALASAIR